MSVYIYVYNIVYIYLITRINVIMIFSLSLVFHFCKYYILVSNIFFTSAQSYDLVIYTLSSILVVILDESENNISVQFSLSK